MQMLGAAIPLGAVITFLIAAPVVHEGTVALLWVTAGPKAAVAFVGAAALLALALGALFGTFDIRHLVMGIPNDLDDHATFLQADRLVVKLRRAGMMALAHLKQVFPYLAAGIFVAAIMEDFVPTELVARLVSSLGPAGVPLATLIGVPVYARIEVMVPMGVILLDRGVPFGTVTAFMMAASALSVPEMMLLSRVFRPRLLGAYVAAVSLAIILFGYGFNLYFTGHP